MSSQIIPYVFQGKPVRIVEIDGEPWFYGSDVAAVLGYKLPRKAVIDHCKAAQKLTVPKRNGQNGGAQFVTIIPERDVYRLIMQSKLPQAEAFEEWVVGDVLPTIRKTGRSRARPAANLSGW